ncbi:TPA: hypothetical protein KDX61_004878, partial [Vibrio parahaemolyticus]|nr:hypothetical protein [Vibrio parahaemolyticus]
MGLFRQEAIDNNKDRAFGGVSIALPIFYNYGFVVLLLMFISSAAFVLTSTYQRKENVNGYIFPNKGVIKLYSPDSTYVYSVNVLEGDTVVAGQVIAELRYSNNALIGHDLNGDVANELENQIEIIMRRKINLEAL